LLPPKPSGQCTWKKRIYVPRSAENAPCTGEPYDNEAKIRPGIETIGRFNGFMSTCGTRGCFFVPQFFPDFLFFAKSLYISPD